MQPEHQLSTSNTSSTLHLPIIYKPDKTSNGRYKVAKSVSKVTELTDRIEKIIEEWCQIGANPLTDETIKSLSERTQKAIEDLNTLSVEYRIKSIPYVQNLSERVLNNFYQRPKKEYEVLVKGIFNISSNKELGKDTRWNHEGVWNKLMNALAEEAYGKGKIIRNALADISNPNGISLYNKCIIDHLRKKYDEELSSFENDEPISPIFPQEIWDKIVANMDLEAISPFRKVSKKARMFSDERSLNKISQSTLLQFKRNNGKLRGIHSNYSAKVQLYDEQLIAKEFIKHWNAKEISKEDLGNLTSEPLSSINDWIAFLGDECKTIEHLAFPNIVDNNSIRDVLSQLYKFTHLRELSLSISNDLVMPDPDQIKKFPLIKSLHLNFVKNHALLNSMLALFPNTAELTCHDFKKNVFENLNLPDPLKKIVLNRCRLNPITQKIDLPVTHLSIIDPVFNEAKINVSFSDLVHFDVKNADINLKFLNKSACLESIVIDQKKFEFQPMKADLSRLESKSLKTLTLIHRGDKPKISLKSSVNLTLSDLEKFSSLETLTFQGILIDDFSVLADHPSLKTLHIKNCTNMPTAEALENKGITVVYET